MVTPDISELIAGLSPEKRALLATHLKNKGANPNTFPLSYAQERIWFIQHLDPGSSLYNTPFAVRLNGALDVAALEKAINEVTRRHEILRSVFPLINGEPVQVIRPPQPQALPVRDLRALPESEREKEVLRITVEEGQKPFDLSQEPPARTHLLRLKDDEHVVVRIEHHIISDASSQEIFVREVATLYAAYADGKPSPLPELPLQYADYAVWQRKRLQGEALEQQLDYWKRQLGGNIPLLNLPTYKPRQAVQSYRGAIEMDLFPARLASELAELSRREGVTLFITLLAAFQTLLHRYSNESDIPVGTPILNRNRVEFESLMGFFGNTLVMRTDLSGDPTFRELLRREREVAQGAYANQDVPFEKVVRVAQPERSLSYTPLLQVMFTLQTASEGVPDVAGLTWSPLNIDTGSARFDLMLSIEQTPTEMGVMLQYASDLFTAETSRRMLVHLRNLLEGIARDPGRRLSEYSLLSETERRQILSEWNDTERDYGQHKTLHALLAEQAARPPDAPALTLSGQQLSYGELHARANQLARHLQTLGVKPEVRVGILMERSLEMVISLLAVLKAGGAYVPLDPAYPQDRLAFMLEDSDVPVLLTQQHLLGTLPAHHATVVAVDSAWPRIAQLAADDIESGATPDNLAYVIYTSGSTGLPKGSMIAHRGIVNRLLWMQEAYGLTPSETVLQKTPFSFDVSVWEFFWPLLVGARLALAVPGGHQDTDYLLRAIREEAVTTLHFVPSMLQVLLEAEGVEQCTSLRRVICSGEALSTELQQRFFARSAAELHNLYGPTEASVDVTFWECLRGDERPSVPIGRPIANTQIYLLDEHLQPLPVGVAGELYIGGDGLARGYLRRPELTAEKFVPHPFATQPGARLYRTGDQARHLPGGEIEYLGRLDQQVKLRGFRIELGEIETALAAHPSIREVAVVLREDVPGDKRLAAYLVATREAVPNINQLREFLQERLPDYMVPAAFVFIESLPLTPSGKLDRRALPALDYARPELQAQFVAPRTEAERVLAAIWSDVLRVERIGVHDGFFELGGDSILSIQVISRANEKGLRLLPKQIFQYQTIAQLANAAETAPQVEAEQGAVVGAFALTPIQRWFFEQEFADPHHFNQALTLEITQPFDTSRLPQIIERILEQHDALRLRFEKQRGVWQQLSGQADVAEVFLRVDLSHLPAEEQGRAIEDKAAELQQSLNLTTEPLLKVALFEAGEGRRSRLLIIIHHLAVDGVSWRILLEDLEKACRQSLAGERINLGAKTTSFKQWSERLAQHAQTRSVEAEAGYWRAEARRHVKPLPRETSGEGVDTVLHERRLSSSLSVEETRALLHEVGAAYHTQINDVLLAALVRTLSNWTGERRFLVDLEGHGREDILEGLDVSRTVGWFTTIFPVLLEQEGNWHPGETLRQVKEQLRAIPQRGIGYGLLRYLSQDESIRAQLAELPPAELIFNYLGQLDGTLSETGHFALARESAGAMRSPRSRRPHLLDVSASIVGGQLQVAWSYGEQTLQRQTVEGLAAQFVEALREIIGHCLTAEPRWTPSDFPLAKLRQEQLDRILRARKQVEDIYALSPMQEGMLFQSLYEAGTGVYVTQVTCELRGELDIPIFEQSWQQVVNRHASLRTSFEWESLDAPVQVVNRQVEISLEQADWRGLEPGAQHGLLESYLRTVREQGLNLSEAPLMKFALFRTGEDVYRFVWNCHHLLVDGWSLPIIIREVFAVYDARRRGALPSLAESRPYKDFIAWLHQQDADSAETYWRATLEGRTAPTAIEVGKAAPNAETDSPDYDEQEISFTADETQRLHEAAKRLHVTVNTLVQGAWGLLLSRYSNEDDVIFGVTSSGRPPSLHGVEKIVGIFINTLPTRVRVPHEASVGGWLQELQARQAEQRQFEYSTLAQVHGWSEIPRSMRLFDSILVYENYPPYDFERGGGGGRQLEVGDIHAHGRTNYPLTVLAKGTSELLLKMWYDTSRFDDSTISRMLGHLRRIIQSLSSDAEQRLADVDILSEPERQQLLVEWNSPQTSYPATACIHELFEQQAARRPDAVALVSDEASLTYAELNARANRLAHHLRASGVGAEARVGLMLERSPEMVVALLAVLKAGGAYVPLDPSYPDERLSFLLGDAGLHTLVTVQKFADRTGSARANVVLLDADADQLASQPEDNPAQLAHPDNLAYIIYTSGSTGQPKGALVTHENITRLFAATEQYYKFDAADVWTLFHSYAFDFSVWELWGALAYGGRLVVVSHAVSRAPEEFYELLVRERVTVLNQTPSAFRQLMSAEESARAGQQLALRFVIFGGEALELSSLKPWFERHGDERPRLVNMYGITETTVHVTYRPLTFADARSGGGSRIGVALPDLQVYVLDRELRPVPVGVPGELYVGGAGVARGYLNQAALTAERFIPHPYSAQPGARLYRSGDLARFLPGGDLEYLGRNDQQVKIRGFRIEPGEVEAALREQSGIEDCAVMVRESAEGEKRLVAYCVRRSGAEFAELSAGQLRAQLKQRLPDYMLPSQVVMLDALPLTPNGKVDRKALSAVESVESEPDTKFSAPRTPVEELLASIWASVLDVERVGRDDEFFELGGHSLLATQIMSRVRETFNVEVPLSALFENSTPSGLAMRIEEAMRAGEGISTAPLKPVSREQILPLSFAQQRLWFLDQLEPGSFFYNIPAVLRLNGRLDITVLERTLTEITRRHEVLRSTFVATASGAPAQVVNPPIAFQLPLTDLSALPPEEREAEAVRLATLEAQKPFDLARGPLLRLSLLRLDEEQHIALVTLHHIISDGWSTGILIREVAALYEAYSEGKESPLEELEVQYADYAVWQREWLQGEVLEEQLGYWRKQLGGELGVVELPTDRPRPAVQSYRGMHESLMVSPELSRSLKELCRREGVTLYMAMLGAFASLLHQYTGQTDIIVGTPIAGRNRAEVEGLIGFFVNTLVLRTEMGGEPSFREVLRRVREVALGAYAHQDVPFEKLVEELQPDRDLSRHPLFQVMLEIQNEGENLLELPALSMESVEVDDATAKFDLTLLVGESENGLSLRFEYSVDLFEAETIKRMGRHFENLLEGIVADPAQAVADVSLLTDAERVQLLAEWNETTTPFPLEQCFHELFEAQSERSPEAVAAAHGDARLTYRELNERANQLAHYLRTQGAKPEDRICVYMDRGLDLLVSILAIFKAGGVYVPLDPAYPKERIAFILEDAQVSLLLTRQQFLDNLPELNLRLIRLDTDWEPAIAAQSTATPSNVTQPDNLAYVIYTSGSTGLPKGAMIEHRGMVNHLFAKIRDLQLTGADIVGQTASQAFDISVWQFLVALLVGGRVEIFGDEIAHHPARLFAATAREQLTVLEIVPALLGGILETDAADFDLRESSGLRWLLVTGEALPPHLCRRWMELQPDVPLMNAYGPTECSDDVTHYVIDAPLPPEVIVTPIGAPVANMRLYVVDKMLRLLPVGVAGELCAGGIGVGRGYLNQPSLTAQKFVPDPFAAQPGARLYRTGDLARYLPDGNIEFLGRLDHQVKVRGFRIELGEIEAALRNHPAVREAVVLVNEQQTGDARLSAYVVAAPESSPTPDEFRSHLKKALPEYMIPSSFVMLETLPLTPNGKIDRKALARLDAESAPAARIYVAPRTAVEEVVTGIWAELLKLEQIGVHDNFFELGGHSLLSIQVLSRLQKTFQVELPLRVLFEAATVAELSEQIVAMEAKPGQTEKIARIVKKLGSLSAEDKQRMLQQKRQREVTRHEV